MKLISLNLLPIMFCIVILLCACTSETWLTESDERLVVTDLISAQEKLPFANSGIEGTYPSGSPVALHGKLKVIGTQLCDESGKPIQLRGLFLRGLNDEAKLVNHDALAYLSEKWGMDVFRIPLWTIGGKWSDGNGPGSYEPGYIKNPGLGKYIKDAVQFTEECGIYCIIDWHIMNDGDPNRYREESRDFFKRMAFLYGAKKHVLYEICNEPNHVKWGSKIKPYVEYIIPVIRAGDPQAIIIVGTEVWCIDLHHAAANPLKYDNIMYSVHFYPHMLYPTTVNMTKRVKEALSNIAVFCTEWGVTSYKVGEVKLGVNGLDEAKAWVNFLNENKISWCNYALTDIREATSFLKPGLNPAGGWVDKNLTESGIFIRDQMKNR